MPTSTEVSLKNRCGPQVKALRLKAGLSQQELANKLNAYGLSLTQDTIYRIEKQKRNIYEEEIYVLARFFDISIDELFSLNKPIH